MKILHQTLTRRWFNLIASGEKKIDYREDKPYWRRRLFNKDGTPKHFDEIHFTNGYGKYRPFMRVEFEGLFLTVKENCNPRHGEDLPDNVIGEYLGKVLEVRR